MLIPCSPGFDGLSDIPRSTLLTIGMALAGHAHLLKIGLEPERGTGTVRRVSECPLPWKELLSVHPGLLLAMDAPRDQDMSDDLMTQMSKEAWNWNTRLMGPESQDPADAVSAALELIFVLGEAWGH